MAIPGALVQIALATALGAVTAHGFGWGWGAGILFGLSITFFVGKRGLADFLGWVAVTRSRELFTLSVLAVALGIAVSSATLFGASMALGAFLAWMIVSQSAYKRYTQPTAPSGSNRR